MLHVSLSLVLRMLIYYGVGQWEDIPVQRTRIQNASLAEVALRHANVCNNLISYLYVQIFT